MKLYAITTSERASKGQGGNDRLEIVIMAGSKSHDVMCTLILQPNYPQGVYELVMIDRGRGKDEGDKYQIINTMRIRPEDKIGNKQKTAKTCEKCNGQFEGNCAYCLAR